MSQKSENNFNKDRQVMKLTNDELEIMLRKHNEYRSKIALKNKNNMLVDVSSI